MKKGIIAVAMMAAIGLGVTGVSAYAWNCGGPGAGWHGRGGIEYDNADYRKFMDQTVDIRKSIAGDRAELNAIMAGTDPDPKRVRELTESLATSQEKLAEMARQAEIDVPAGRSGFGPGYCGGPGRGYGPANCPGPGYGRYR